MLTSIIVVIIVKEKIKNFKRKSVIYTIFIASKYEILLESEGLRGIYLIILFFCLAYFAIIIYYYNIICFYYIIILLYHY